MRAIFAEALRVLKPGGHALVFGGPRTFHRLTCAIEDAGFEIRDDVAWLFDSAAPVADFMASLDPHQVKMLDRMLATLERPAVLAWLFGAGFPKSHNLHGEWEGWGTALKPGWEPVIVARKPLGRVGTPGATKAGRMTVAANVEAHGTGALNVDGCRIGVTVETWPISRARPVNSRAIFTHGLAGDRETQTVATGDPPAGRWPANVAHDGSPEVMERFAEFGERADATSNSRESGRDAQTHENARRHQAMFDPGGHEKRPGPGDSGSAARFFYSGKAVRGEREAGLGEAGLAKAGHYALGGFPDDLGKTGNPNCVNNHPTVKPLALMRWLVRLVTPPGGIVLDPFAGSGTTLCAAAMEGAPWIGIEREERYCQIARARAAHWSKPESVHEWEASAEFQAEVSGVQGTLFEKDGGRGRPPHPVATVASEDG